MGVCHALALLALAVAASRYVARRNKRLAIDERQYKYGEINYGADMAVISAVTVTSAVCVPRLARIDD